LDDERIIKTARLFIVDFARTQPELDRILNILFEGCVLLGPAILSPAGNTRFIRPRFDSWNEDFMFCEKPDGAGLRGSIRVENVIFEDCAFAGIGFSGPSVVVANMRKLFHEALGFE
jgi:hypothetical protein